MRLARTVALLVGFWTGGTASAALGQEGPVLVRKLATPEIPRRLPEGTYVAPFLNGSGSSSLEWLRVGFVAALAMKLDHDPALRILNPETFVPEGLAPTVDEAGVEALAKHTGARWVWTGSFTRPEWKLDFDVRLWSVESGTATLVGEKHEHGDFSDVFDLSDDAIVELLAKVGRPVPEAALARMRRPPTKDFYAFTLAGRGLLALVGLGQPTDLAAAEKNLGRAVFIDPKLAEAHRLLALVLLRKGQAGSARGHLNYALDLEPDDYRALATLVRLSADAKQRDEGIDLAVRALALRPWDLDTRYLLGAMLWEEGETDGALRELKRVTDVMPEHLPARRILVLVHAAMGNVADLAAELEHITELDPGDEAAKLDLGAAYHALDRDEAAIAIYQAVIARDPKHVQALKFLGDLYRKKGDLETAIGFYEKALAANRNDPRPYFLLGSAYLSKGADDKALRIYREAERFPRYLAETYSNLGALYYKRGNNAEALVYLRVAAQKKPQSPRIRYNYGLALAKARQRDLALGEFSAASELDPNDADLQYGLGVALLRVGRIDDAEKAFQAAVRLDPEHKDAHHNLQLIDELRRRAREGEIQIE
jgi:tetratricopeptide (TPR) repeat protein/TolB-like protein